MIGPEQWGTGRIVRCLYREADWPPSKQSAPYQIKLDRKTADRVGIPPQHALIYSDWDDDIKVGSCLRVEWNALTKNEGRSFIITRVTAERGECRH